MPKKPLNYSEMARAVNPYVAWDLSRRKRLTAAEKGKIRRAYDKLVEMRRSGFTPTRIRRTRGESQRAYKRRLADIKARHGERGSPLVAVGVRVSKTERVTVRGKRVKVVSRKTGRRQWFLAADPRRLALDPAAEARRLWGLAIAEGADRVRVALGSRRRGDFSAFVEEEDLVEAVEGFAELYKAELRWVVVGVLAERGGGVRR